MLSFASDLELVIMGEALKTSGNPDDEFVEDYMSCLMGRRRDVIFLTWGRGLLSWLRENGNKTTCLACANCC